MILRYAPPRPHPAAPTGNGRLDAIDVQLATARSPKQRAMLKKAASMLNVTEDDTEDSVSDTVDASPMRISAIKVRNALRLTPQPSSTTESPVSWDVGADAPARIAPSGVSAPGTVSGTAPEQAHAQLGAQQHNRKPPPTWEPEPVWDPEVRPAISGALNGHRLPCGLPLIAQGP